LQFGSNNEIFVTGGTTSNNLPTSGGLHPTPRGFIDGFIFRLSNDGQVLMNGTYIGTSAADQSYMVQTDKKGFVYVLGQSQGSYPIVNAPYAVNNSYQFIHKLNATLDTTIFSTQIGSGRSLIDLVPTAFLVNDCENIFVSGWGGAVNYYGTNSQGGTTQYLPTTPTAVQKHSDGSDFYLMVLKKDVQDILYATFFGGNGELEHVDGGTSRFDKRGIVYQSVCGGCGGTSRFPVTPNPHSASNNATDGGRCNNAVFKFDLSNLKADFDVDTTMDCGISPVLFTNKSIGGSSFIWDLGDGNSSTSAGSFTHTYPPGTYTVQLIAIDETTCIGRDTMEKIIRVHELPQPQLALDTVIICKGDTAQLNSVNSPGYTYLWSPPQYLTSTSIHNPKAFPPVSQYYRLHIKDTITQCENTDSVLVMIVNAYADTRWENITGCSGKAAVRVKNYSDKEGFTYVWDFGDGTSLTTDNQEVTHTYDEFGNYIVTVVVSNQSCSITDTAHVSLPPIKIPNLFTPNGDDHNDKYVIEGMTKNWKLEVYNRWGNSVYTREPYDQSWDGEDLNGGIYYFLITDPAGNKCKGWVHVMK